MIVKVQVPLTVFNGPTDEPLSCMVYNEDRSVLGFAVLTDMLIQLLDGDLKGYFEVEFNDGNMTIHTRVEAQDW